MPQFRKKPVVIEARQLLGSQNSTELARWCGGFVESPTAEHSDWQVLIPTLEGTMRANVSDWIICGVKGEFYPCKDEILRATYDPVVS